ncbi:MAG: NAD(P)/FAD-dependent oxidoreductase [Candidatus Dormibacteraeota bacterium]|nr:NAD(P)/FAD-dependent oxidoreductase [Candidatus Dormibacteraeota bacterium]
MIAVLGGGPAGLTAAYELSKLGLRAIVLEKDPRTVGGIARTVEHHGYCIDIGGHRFFSKSQEIEDFWTEVFGDRFITCSRLSRIYYNDRYFDYPLKAVNALKGLGPIEAIRCVASYGWAQLFPVKNPVTYEDWVRNGFGQRLFEIFFKTYTEKVWGMGTREITADWAAQRIRTMTLAAAIKDSVLPPRTPGSDKDQAYPLMNEFRYPPRGPGQLWEHVAELLKERGSPVQLGHEVLQVRHRGGRVVSVLVENQKGETQEVVATDFISTLPIRDLVNVLEPAAPKAVRDAANGLRYRDYLTVVLMIDRKDLFPDNWLYIHEPGVRVGRIQNYKAWSAQMVPDQTKSSLGLEYFCFEGDGLWSSSDQELIALATRELGALDICQADEVFDGVVVRQTKAYPVYDADYKANVGVVREYVEANLPNLHLVGRNGMHHYNNQDHSMMTALLTARNIAAGSKLYDPWKVNNDAEYHEEARPQDEDRTGRLMPRKVA